MPPFLTSLRRVRGKGQVPAGTRDPRTRWSSVYTFSSWRDGTLLPPSPCGLRIHRRAGRADAPQGRSLFSNLTQLALR